MRVLQLPEIHSPASPPPANSARRPPVTEVEVLAAMAKTQPSPVLAKSQHAVLCILCPKELFSIQHFLASPMTRRRRPGDAPTTADSRMNLKNTQVMALFAGDGFSGTPSKRLR